MRFFRLVCLALCCLALLGACHATNSVELFRVNENGEVVNIGRGSDDEHVIYGHFRLPDVYERAFVTVQALDSEHNSVCYIKINEGQIGSGVGVGIRLSPCSRAKLVNEVATARGLDGIGVYDLTNAPWGVYTLYLYDGSTFVPLIERPVFDEHLAVGLDAFRVNPQNPNEAFVTYSHKDENGRIGMIKETVGIDDVLAGKLLRLPDAADRLPAQKSGNGERPPIDSRTECDDSWHKDVVSAEPQDAVAPSEKPTETPTTSAPTETPTASAPTETPTTSASTETPTTSAPTETPTTAAPTGTPTIAAPIETPTTAAPTGTPTELIK